MIQYKTKNGIVTLANAISEIDSEPKAGSKNPVTSDGLKRVIDEKSSVSVSDTGTSSTIVKYITIDGTESKLPMTSVIDNLTSTETTSALSANQGNILNTAISNKASVSVSSSGTSTNEVKYIIIDGTESKLPTTPVIDNLTSSETTSALSANQGNVLNTSKLSLSGGLMTGGINFTPELVTSNTTISVSSNDITIVNGAYAITVSNGDNTQAWCKIVVITNASATISFDTTKWGWVGGEVPTLVVNSQIVLFWNGNNGIAQFISTEE